MLCGRGAGKTRGGTEQVMAHLRKYGKGARVAVGGPTFGDARDVCAEGDSGFITLYRHEFTKYNRSLGEAYHINGGYVKLMGSEEPARWNGPQWTMLWADELALWNEDSWDQALFGLRLGQHPRAICTTTPKSREFVKQLCSQPFTAVTSATTKDNPFLSEIAVRRLYEKYGNTVLGRQELLAEFVKDVEGAYWNSQMIDRFRVGGKDGPKTLPTFVKVVVAVDPAGTHKPESDKTGIVVAARGWDGHFYVFHGFGYSLSPAGWGNRVLELYDDYEANKIIGEKNQGGEMVGHTILSMVPPGRMPPKVDLVHAKRGKATRAEPVAALYEQGLVHHYGVHSEMEDQMCSFPVSAEKKDMVDALVYALTDLAGGMSLFNWNTGEADRQCPWN